ncbi:ribosomal protein S18-alanine N-acetyltransferase [Fastidiosibacter lacustris]|uniref:ribosomal protein S18-alanine N-acetyltransferase n=1 Tax=Fastidiosibacter lacustris TaxID=2056695 RepID=UPI000E3541F2|nr:ribosomal protein S18-alanine N-acetyltransferase [Fastidiosibacter lacustris]
MSTQYQILPLSENYLPQMMDIEREVFDHPWSASLMKDSILSAHTETWGLLDPNDRLIAFVVVSAIFDEAEILNFSVAKIYQHQGFGQKLLAYLMNHLAYKKIEKLFLEVGVSNIPAISIYKKYGFEQISVRKNYYQVGDKQEDALVLQATLQPKESSHYFR